MSLKIFKPSENSANNPEPSVEGLRGAFEKRWKNTWSFNLHKTIPLGEMIYWAESNTEMNRKRMRKYYGKKILYITKPQEANAIVSRSKLLKSVKTDGDIVISNGLKSKGNLVISSYPSGSYLVDYRTQAKKWLLLKKIFRNCQKAEIEIRFGSCLRLLKEMLALRFLSIKIDKGLGLASLGGVFRNLLDLEVIKAEAVEYEHWYTVSPENTKHGFFASVHKLSRLKKVKLGTDYEAIQGSRDLDRFSRQLFNFNFSVKIQVYNVLEIEENSDLARILNAAKYLSVSYSAQEQSSEDRDFMRTVKEARRKMKCDKKNSVKLFSESYSAIINVASVLSYCDSLEHLYIQERRHLISWKTFSDQEEIKGFRNLKTVALNFSHFIVDGPLEKVNKSEYDHYYNNDDEIEIWEDENNYSSGRYSSPMLALFSHLKETCPSLQHLCLFLSALEFPDFRFSDVSPFTEIFNEFIQELSTFDKLKAVALLIGPDDFRHFALGDILSSNSLESFQLKFRPDAGGLYPHWDACFPTENKSEIKKLAITIPARKKVPLFGTNLLNYIGTLENLREVKLIDRNLEIISFDFLCGLVTSLLEKKDMRKILICTKVKNTGGAQFSQELESRVSTLKDLQLEEIMVGKLQGYGFNYLFYDKEMQLTDKLFWTSNEIDKFWCEKEEFSRKYHQIIDLLEQRETARDPSSGSDSD